MYINPEYVVFSLHDLQEMILTIRYNVGSIVSIAFYVFVTVLTVYVVISIVDKIGR